MNKFGRDLTWVGVIKVGVISVGSLTVVWCTSYSSLFTNNVWGNDFVAKMIRVVKDCAVIDVFLTFKDTYFCS